MPPEVITKSASENTNSSSNLKIVLGDIAEEITNAVMSFDESFFKYSLT